MRIAAVVLAAGEGRRIGGPKALLPIAGTTFLGQVCRLCRQSGLQTVIAVLGAEAERVRAGIELPEGTVVVVNEAWPSGMLSSLWRGLDEAEARGADAVLVHPVDHPLVAVATLEQVAGALRAGARIAVPTWQGRRGHPGGFAGTLFAELRAASPEQGARALLAAHPDQVVHVAGDPGCVAGIDRPEDLARLVGLPTGSVRS
jgi:CTP:molybdopterin cytidylyltransferase MocA